ncbi:MAG TPA: GHMP kinase, partial [Anaerolineales bacterium]|nr:GHMP kinase [Anaerolineae bacterium]HIQ02076.1 GHMP kinase [Anaerolineales bacterium]
MVLIARAPVRISFGGGGTDLPAYYERYGGLVVSTTIDYYVYTILTPDGSEGVRIISADYRAWSQRPTCEDLIWDGDLRLPKAVTYYFNVRDGVTMFLASQVPPGTGLGSSGSVAVSMVKGLAFWCGLDLGPGEVAELACYIEMEKLGMPVGKQDQYAAAYGGLNCIRFGRGGVEVERLRVSGAVREGLEQGLMLFYTGRSRQSSTILRRQKRASALGDRETLRRLDALKALGEEMREALEGGDLEGFGELLHRSWMEKRRVVEGITNQFLDECYAVARERGALGGKV